jgi:hypothetical protein
VRAAIALIVALVAVPAALAAPTAQQRSMGALPTRGVLVVGKSLAGVPLGATQTMVTKRWGSRYVNCLKTPCDDQTWMYFYPSGEPVGAAVRFRKNKAVAVFTLGAVPGWKSMEGIKIADPASKVYDFYGNPKYTKCIGYEALSLTRGTVTTSFYLTSGVVYGFAITAAGVPVCQ